jgi:ribosomal protein S25
LNTISAIFSTLKLLKTKPVNDTLYKKLEQLFELGISNTSLSLDVAGFGGSYSKEKNQPIHITITSLQELFEEIINGIIEKTNNEIIIHYNNLELLHENKLRYLFNNLRDFFQIKGVHFIFVGNLTVRSSLQGIPRFSSILTDTPFCIENLTFEETTEVINKRFEALRISKEYNITIPFTQDALRKLYDLMNGNIRSVLNSLHTAVIEITNEKPVLLNANDLSKTLKLVLEKRYISKLTDKQKEVLFEIAKHEEITNKSISDKLNIKRSNVSIYIKDLINEGLVYLRRKNGKDKFWSARPHIKWHSLTETNTQQQILHL